MLIRLHSEKEEEKVNAYLHDFGVGIVYGRVHGEVTKIPDETDIDPLKVKLVKAIHHTGKEVAVAHYLGNLPDYVTDDFKEAGLYINQFDTLVIKEPTYENYRKLEELKHKFDTLHTFVIVDLLSHWPNTSIRAVRNGNSYYQLVPRFDYHEGALLYQTELLAYFCKIEADTARVIAKVEIKENEPDDTHKYTVTVGYREPIKTDTLVTPTNVISVVLERETWLSNAARKIRNLCVSRSKRK